MEILSFLGVLIGFGALLFGNFLEGGQMSAILNPVAFLIVMGGTIGAVMVHTPTKIFFKSLASLPRVFFPPKLPADALVKEFIVMAKSCKKDGLIRAAGFEKRFKDPFVVKAIKMLSDGAEVALIEDILRHDIELEERNHQLHADFFKSMGGYSPTIGLVGAILGLINVMNHLSEPEKLGHGLAVAFTATLYGVAFANLIFIPIAEKLTIFSEREADYREMILAGVVSIKKGESVSVTESRMKSFLDERLSSGWS